MPATDSVNDEQAKLWNGTGGQAWVEAQPVLDQALAPYTELLLEAWPAEVPGQALDVGCGTGATTLAVARRLGPKGRATGVDISEPMLAAARERATREGTPATFLRADAQTHEFEPASFDRLVSRFGVMFFDDPIRAFANLRRAARDNAQLQFVAWRSPAENPFMTTAEQAAAPLLPGIPPREPDAPGQFAFANRDRVFAILEAGGWADIDLRPADVACTFPEKALVRYFTRLGPLGRILQDTDAATRTRIIQTVRAAFDPYVHGSEVRFTGACWLARARALS
jgi:SAM-dependent methyltransferase